MFRNDIYAKFADIFDSPEEPRAVFQPDGKIEFVAQNEGAPAASSENVSDKRHLTGYTPSSSLRRKVMIFGVFCVLVVILLVITIANLVLLVQNQTQIARNSKSLQNAPAAGIVMVNGTGVDVKRLEDAIFPYIQKDMEEAMKTFKTDIAKDVRDHPITADHINKTVNEVLESWGGGVLSHLQNFNMDTLDLEKEMNALLSNLSTIIIQRLRVELGFTQYLFQRRIYTLLGNLSTVTVNRLKEELEIDPVHLETAVHKALNNLSERSLALIRGVCETAYGGKCYWIVKTGIVPYKPAESLCEQRGAMAANIYDEGHYKAMLKYIRNKMSITMNSIWLGMVRDPTSDRNYFVNGTESSFKIPWAQNYPISNTRAIHLGITFSKNASYTGFFNDVTNNFRMGILCEL